MPQTDLKELLYDPAKSISAPEYQKLHRQKTIQALFVIATGLIILIVAPVLYAHGQLPDQHRPRNNGSGLVVLGFGLPLLGLYMLMTVKRRIKNKLRAKLLQLHPELISVEIQRKTEQKDSKTPTIIVGSIVVLLVGLGLYFWIVSLIKFAHS